MTYAIVAVLILILDQGVKYLTSLKIALDTGEKALIPGVVHLTNIHNRGAAFGILQDARWLFVVITVLFVIAVIVALSMELIRGSFGRWMAVLVMAGAVGNGIDRLLYGYVVDMFQLEFISFPVFNVADIFVTVGGILFCLYVIFHKEYEPEAAVPETEKKPGLKLFGGAKKAEEPAAPKAPKASHAAPKTKKAPKAKPEPESVGLRAPARANAAQPVKKTMPAMPDDPFSEWEFDSSKADESFSAAPAKPRPAAPAKTEAPAAPAQPAAPARPAPAQPAKPRIEPDLDSLDDMDFSLEDILNEFGGNK